MVVTGASRKDHLYVELCFNVPHLKREGGRDGRVGRRKVVVEKEGGGRGT